MAVVTPLNNFLGPEGDTVTVDKQLLNTEYCGWGYPRPPLTEMEDRRATVTARYSQQHSGYTRLRPVPRHKCRPGTPGILKYVIRSGSFLRKGMELSNTVS